MNPPKVSLSGTMREVPRDALREVGGGAPPTWSGNPSGIDIARGKIPDHVNPPAGPLHDDGSDPGDPGGGI